MRFENLELGLRAWESRFRVWALGSRVWDLGFGKELSQVERRGLSREPATSRWW